MCSVSRPSVSELVLRQLEALTVHVVAVAVALVPVQVQVQVIVVVPTTTVKLNRHASAEKD
jgi:hypothetical protein